MKNLNTLLTALYVLVDDHVVPPRTGRGHRPDLTDSELICLAVAQVILGYTKEPRWVRHVHANPELLGMFRHAQPIRLPQATEDSTTTALQGHHRTGDLLSLLVR
jgi:hypothetical protein